MKKKSKTNKITQREAARQVAQTGKFKSSTGTPLSDKSIENYYRESKAALIWSDELPDFSTYREILDTIHNLMHTTKVSFEAAVKVVATSGKYKQTDGQTPLSPKTIESLIQRWKEKVDKKHIQVPLESLSNYGFSPDYVEGFKAGIHAAKQKAGFSLNNYNVELDLPPE